MTWVRRYAEVLVPAAALAVGVVEVISVTPPGWGWGIAVESVAAVLLVGRRRWPLATCTTAAVVLLLMPWLGPQLDDLAAPILFLALLSYSLARWLPDLRGVVGLVVLGAMLAVDHLLVDVRSEGFGDVVFAATLIVPPYVLGRLVRTLDGQRQRLTEQSEQLRDAAVREERDRIAREMHDVIAHSISAMVVQTAAAQDLLRTRPDQAAVLLERVAELGRQALGETGRLLHLVRDDADELGLRPAPGLGQVPDLVESSRSIGLDLEADLRLPDHPLPGGVDVTAYRVVQEALTNARRHGSGPTELVVAADSGRLLIRCSNQVDGAARPGSGLGLQGMAERVGLVGGTLRHEAHGDRFVVEADLPLVEVAG